MSHPVPQRPGLTEFAATAKGLRMYPFVRMIHQSRKVRNAPKLGLFDAHLSHHYCLPWDIDLWLELNNGRTLTLFDLGRIPMSIRNGTAQAAKTGGFGMAVAGASVRYRKRVTTFQKVDMWTKPLGFDDRFLYIEQSMWDQKGDCCNHILIRGAVIKNRKMVPPRDLLAMIEPDIESPPLPEWVQNWIAADNTRPWPPVRD
ncbi:acyl-CoA thioesterase [Celeribacter baekdonensis]|uniref:acyl-CoA thioesterase n=1 Tax=Celeribacter baekdonensis TaxID=875171 RepID=UPI003A8FA692